MHKPLWGFILSLGLLVLGVPVRAEDLHGAVTVNGVERTYLLHIPQRLQHETAPLPLILVFHGGGGSAYGMPRLTGMNAAADAAGFIVAYPNGTNRLWNDGRSQRAESPDDRPFIAALVKKLSTQYPINPHRVYAAGISNGAMFTQYLACTTDSFAGIAAIAGEMPADIKAQCAPAHPVSVLLIHGTSDPLVPYHGGSVKVMGNDRGTILSAEETLAFWGKHNGCKPVATSRTLPVANPADPTRISLKSYDLCKNGTKTALYTVDKGGHTWPGGMQYLPVFMIGPTSRQMDASTTILQFFDAH